MKALFLATLAATLLGAAPVQAYDEMPGISPHMLELLTRGSASAPEPQPDPNDTRTRAEALAECKGIAAAANAAMTARQSGVPMVQTMEDVGDSLVLQDMVVAAYAEVRWPDNRAERQQFAISEFENEQYAACVKAAPRE